VKHGDAHAANGPPAPPDIHAVRSYWERNPVAAAAIPHPLGTPEYFACYDALREANETPAFASRLHEYNRFAGTAVLDVGCGNGYVLSRYARAGASVFGIDLTQVAVGLSRRRFELTGLAGHFTVGNAERLPFADATFDCVCSMGVLHHTPDTQRAVGEVFRVLRPGGTVVLMFYHRNSAQNRIKFPLVKWFAGKSIQQSINEVDGVGNPKGDVYSRSELTRLLTQFRDVQLFAGVFPWHAIGRLRVVVPPGLRARLEDRWGWFLYAKGTRA
jgi:SAM-dependent methyltransferase